MVIVEAGKRTCGRSRGGSLDQKCFCSRDLIYIWTTLAPYTRSETWPESRARLPHREPESITRCPHCGWTASRGKMRSVSGHKDYTLVGGLTSI